MKLSTDKLLVRKIKRFIFTSEFKRNIFQKYILSIVLITGKKERKKTGREREREREKLPRTRKWSLEA